MADTPKSMWNMLTAELEKLKYDDALEALDLDNTIKTLTEILCVLPPTSTYPRVIALAQLRDNMAILKVRRKQARKAAKQRAIDQSAEEMTAMPSSVSAF